LYVMKVLINNRLIEYKDEGSGRVLLLLHGWGMNLATFDKLAKHLTKKFRVIRLDFPGFGQSPQPNSDWSVSDYSQLVRDFLQKIKADDLYAIIAHSFGGRVTIKGISLGFLQPEKVVFIGVAGVKPRQSLKKSSYKIIAKIGKTATTLPIISKLQPVLREKLYSSAGSMDYLNSGTMKKIFLNTICEDLLPEVKNITQPTLLIWGENDTETPLDDARLILSSLKNGHLVVIANAGHFVYTEAYDKVVAELDEFL
jgi:pimeloyl-ACP methyl ester carboxylesterase